MSKKSKFKANDLVVCAEPIFGLIKNAVYKVEIVEFRGHEEYVKLTGDGNYYFSFRFKICTNPDSEPINAGVIVPLFPKESLENVFLDVQKEYDSATKCYPPFNSAHEGFAVLKEEVDELWDHVKFNQKRRNVVAMRKECIQVAAMALRFATDVCNDTTGRK